MAPESKLIRKTLEQAEQYIQDRRFNDAITALEKVRKNETKDPDTLAELCATFMHLGMMKDAQRVAQRWQKIAPKNPMVYTTLGSLCLYHRGQWYGPGFDLEKALDYLNKAIELDPKNEMACQMAGLACFHQDALDTAAHYLRLASEINPFHEQHHYWLGRVAFRKQDAEGAINCLERVVRINGKHPQAYRFLGWVYYERQEWEKSIEAYRKAIQINPSDPTPYLRLGLIYGIHLNQSSKAIEHFKKVINQFPQWVPGYTGLADTFREQHKFAEAVAWYIRALQKDPSAGYPLVQLYHLFRDIGEVDIVKQIARVGIKSKPRSEYEEMDYVDRARFFAILDKVNVAHQLLNKYADKYPTGVAASVLQDYRTLIDHPSALLEVDKSILKRISSRLTPAEIQSSGEKESDAAQQSKKATSGDSGAFQVDQPETPKGFFTHEYVLLRQFDWEPTESEREDARGLWREFYQNFRSGSNSA